MYVRKSKAVRFQRFIIYTYYIRNTNTYDLRFIILYYLLMPTVVNFLVFFFLNRTFIFKQDFKFFNIFHFRIVTTSTHSIRCDDGSVPAMTDGQDNPFVGQISHGPVLKSGCPLFYAACARLIINVGRYTHDEDRTMRPPASGVAPGHPEVSYGLCLPTTATSFSGGFFLCIHRHSSSLLCLYYIYIIK